MADVLPLLTVVLMAQRPTYDLAFGPGLSFVHVEAMLVSTPRELEIPLGAADDRVRGFATFIRNLRASNAGEAVELTPVKKSSWTVSKPSSRPLKLSYDVDLTYCRTKWPAGNEKAGMLLDGDLFVVTKPLFISDSQSAAGAEVHVTYPSGLHLLTPWDHSSQNRFITRSREELIDNSLVLGKHPYAAFERNGNRLTLALLGRMRKSKPLIDKALHAIVDRYSAVFPSSRPYRQLVTLFYADEENGEAYANSSAFTTVLPVDESTTLMWANTLAHETLHYWIGGLLHFADQPAGEWFTEGFTEYMANQTLVQAGIFDETTYLRKAEKHMANYEYSRFLSFFRDMSLQESGKLKTRYHLAVYSGGWCVAFALDAMIREHSHGKRSLATFLDALYRDCAIPGKPVTIETLSRVGSPLAGKNLSAFFADYVRGKKTLPLDRYCTSLGLQLMLQQYANEAYLSLSPTSNPQTRELRRGWLHG